LIKILPYCDEVFLYDNENGFEVIGEVKNGRVIERAGMKTEWLSALIGMINEER
jgi:hypothetical protein